MNDREYTNPFEDVYNKAKALRDHMRDAKQNDAEVRESRSARKAKEILRKDDNN